MTKTTFRQLASDILPFLDLYSVCRYGGGPESVENGEDVSYSQLDREGPDRTKSYNQGFVPSDLAIESADAVSHHALCGSDYGGGALVRSNLACARSLASDMEVETGEYPPVFSASGGYGTDVFLVFLDREAEEDALAPFVDLLRGLIDYPVVDEMHFSETEHEEMSEAWESVGASDFAGELEKRIGNECGLVDLTDSDSEALFQLFRATADRANVAGGCGYEHEETGPYFYDDDVAAEVHPVLPFALGLARIDADAALECASEADFDVSMANEARRVQRLKGIGDALSRIEGLIRDAWIREQERRRQRTPIGESSVHTRDRDSERDEGKRIARETILRAHINAGDTSCPIDAYAWENERLMSASIVLRRTVYTAQQTTEERQVTIDIDPKKGWEYIDSSLLASLFAERP